MMDWIKKNIDSIALVLGLGWLLFIFILNRSFIIDEANLARNVVERGYLGFFDNLDYDQFAPPLYLMAAKLCTELLGIHDWVFRIPSLLAAFGVLLLLRRTHRDLGVSREWIAGLLILLVLTPLFFRYATELKQYIWDAFFCMYWIRWAGKRSFIPSSNTEIFSLTIGGVITIWASMTGVFVLFGIGLVMLVKALRSERYAITIIPLFWMVAFGLYFFGILIHDVGNSHLEMAHENYFFDGKFWTASAWEKNASIILSMFQNFFDKTTVSIILSSLAILLGIFRIGQMEPDLSWAIFLIFISAVVASSAHLYSFIPRMTVFLIPLVWVVLGMAVRGISSYGIVILVLWLAMMQFNHRTLEHISQGAEYEDIKSLLSDLKKNGYKAPIIVEYNGAPAYYYYTRLAENRFQPPNDFITHYGDNLWDLYRDKNLIDEKFYVLFAHTFPEEKVDDIIRPFKENLTLEEMIKVPGASLYTFSK